jgi:hypothetical protein
VENIGDGRGALLTDLHDQYRHVLETQVFADGEGYTTGVWEQTPTFDESEVCMVDLPALDDLKAHRLLEVAGGIVGAGLLGAEGETVTCSDEIARWSTCGDFRSATNRHWQSSVTWLDEGLSSGTTRITRLSDVRDIHRRSFRPQYRTDEMFNKFNYRFARDYVEGGWQFDSAEPYLNDDSIDEWGFERESPAVEFHYLDDPVAVQFILGLRSRRLANPGVYASVEGSLCLMDERFDLGRYVRLDHWRGIGAAGWQGRVLQVVSHAVVLDTRRVRLELWDVTRLVPSGV